MEALTVLYDPACALCVRCRSWMLEQASFVRVLFLAATSDEARRRYGAVPWLGEELVVINESGEVWAGPAAFLMCLWALPAWREWSYTMSGPSLAPLAARFFHAISGNRHFINRWLEVASVPLGGGHDRCVPGEACDLGASGYR